MFFICLDHFFKIVHILFIALSIFKLDSTSVTLSELVDVVVPEFLSKMNFGEVLLQSVIEYIVNSSISLLSVSFPSEMDTYYSIFSIIVTFIERTSRDGISSNKADFRDS